MSSQEKIDRMVQADWKKFVVPVDFSKHCIPAVKMGAQLAKKHGGTLHLVHAVEMVYATGFEFAAALPVEKDLLAHAEEEIQTLAKGNVGADVDCKTIVRNGQAYRVVVEYAEEIDADLVVITTHGYTGLKHLALGSVAERIVRHAEVPVIVVPVGDLS